MDNCYYFSFGWISNFKIKVKHASNSKIRELSFLVYGLGSTGRSVISYFKKNKIKNFEVWDDKQKKLFKDIRSHNLKKTLSKVDFIVLSPGISLIKNKNLNKYKKK